MRERLNRNDIRLLAFLALVTAASIAYTRANFFAAFPEASIDLRYSREEITRRAQAFLQEQGYSVQGFRNITLFEPDERARLYLERELGLEEANRLMQGPVSAWRWRARWYRPPQKDEFLVYISPVGRLVGFEREIPEIAPGARLPRDAARDVAERFLRSQTNAAHRLIEEALEERPNRHDHVFTWEQEGFRAKDARYRRTVTIQGDRVGRYLEFLHVPEQWERDFATMRSANELYTQIAQALFFLLVLAALAVLLYGIRHQAIRWRTVLAISGVVAALMVANSWNMLPFFLDGMPTSSTHWKSVVLGLLRGIGDGVYALFFVLLAAAPGEPAYRELRGRALSLRTAFTRSGVRSKEFFLACATGYGLAAAHIAFIVAFYLIGRRFGVWSPQDIRYSDLLSTALPWLYPMAISVFASVSEEFWFRLLAIPLLLRFLKSRWLAIVLPAFVWGFLHANYPQQPAFIRGIEVGLIGVAAGCLMLRFGILSTLVWHYTVDAILIGLFLIRSGSWYFQASGWVVAGAVAFPMLISVWFYWRGGGFEVQQEPAGPQLQPETPAETPAEEPPAVAPGLPAAHPLRPVWPVRWLYIAAALAGTGWLIAKAPAFGEFIRVRLTRGEARRVADAALRSRGLDLSRWRTSTAFFEALDQADLEYLRQHVGVEQANRTVAERCHTGFWRTRYFTPLRREEWRVYVSQSGQVLRVDHLLDENAEGAKLAAPEAERIALRQLEQKGVPVERYRLVDSSREARPRRVDYSFTWEDSRFRAAEATARVRVQIVGDEASGFTPFLKLPEAWVREFERVRLRTLILPAMGGAALLPLLIVLVKRIGRRDLHEARWKVYAGAGLVACAVALVSQVNQWPLLLENYDTADPLENFLVQAVLARLLFVLLLGCAGFAAALAVDVFWQWKLGRAAPAFPSYTRTAALLLLLGGLGQVLETLYWKVPGPRPSLLLFSLPYIDTGIPAISAWSHSFFATLAFLCAGVVMLCAASKFLRPSHRGPAAALLCFLVALGRSENLPQFAFHAGETLLWLGALMLVLKTCGADVFSILAAVWLLANLQAGTVLAEQPSLWLRINGVAVIVGACAAAWGWLWALRRRIRPEPAVGTARPVV